MPSTGKPKPTQPAEIEIPDSLRGCHPLIKKTREKLEAGYVRTDKRVDLRRTNSLSVHVSKGTITRALRIMEGLIRACESRGWKVKIPPEENGTIVCIEELEINLHLLERVSRKELLQKKPSMFRDFEYTATGVLVLEIQTYLGKINRPAWIDSESRKLEQMLPDVVEKLQAAAEYLRQDKIEDEEKQRQADIEGKKREQMRQRVETEKARRAVLVEKTNGWALAQNIRRMADELVRRSTEAPEQYPADAVERWVSWARTVAAKHDPFENGYISEALTLTDLDSSLDCS